MDKTYALTESLALVECSPIAMLGSVDGGNGFPNIKTMLNPFHPETWDNETRLQSGEVAAILRKAGVAERQALEGLACVLSQL